MSSVSQFFGGASGPMIGEAVQFSSAAPANLTIDGKEFLRTGSIKTYSADYDPLIAAHPGLSVFGNDTKVKAGISAAGSAPALYGYVAGKYIAYTDAARYSTDLVTWANLSGAYSSAAPGAFVSNGSYAVWASSSATTALRYSSDGLAANTVAGDFTTNGKAYAHIVNDGNFWCAVSGTLGATNGDIAHITAANPAGAWSFGNPNVTSTTTVAAAAGNGYLVFSTSYTGNASQKIFTASQSTPATVTDRTAALGITTSNALVQRLVFDGSYFVAVLSDGRVFRASNPTSAWEYVGVSPAPAASHLTTDKNGTIALSTLTRAIYVSHDSGSTWSQYQLYRGIAPASTTIPTQLSVANSRWLANPSVSAYQNVIDLGPSFFNDNPDFIGDQTTYGTISVNGGESTLVAPVHLRIK